MHWFYHLKHSNFIPIKSQLPNLGHDKTYFKNYFTYTRHVCTLFEGISHDDTQCDSTWSNAFIMDSWWLQIRHWSSIIFARFVTNHVKLSSVKFAIEIWYLQQILKPYLKNYTTKIRHVCTHLNEFFMATPNKAMKSNIYDILKKMKNLKNYTTNTRHVCTHLNAFLTATPNMAMKIQHLWHSQKNSRRTKIGMWRELLLTALGPMCIRFTL